MKQNRNSSSYLPAVTPCLPHLTPGGLLGFVSPQLFDAFDLFLRIPNHTANEGRSTHPLEHTQTAESHLLSLRPYVLRVPRDCFNIERSPLPR